MKEVNLTQGKVALVDDADFEWLNGFTWYAQNTKSGFYAATTIRRKVFLMHRMILGITDKKIKGEHIDHNPLNNQRTNLRVATHAQNMCNRRVKKTKTVSQFLGVHIDRRKKNGKIWVAQISINRRQNFIGSFHTEKEAAVAYNRKAIETHGEFANLNVV